MRKREQRDPPWLTKENSAQHSVRQVAWGQGSMLLMRECRYKRGKWKTSHLAGGLDLHRHSSDTAPI